MGTVMGQQIKHITLDFQRSYPLKVKNNYPIFAPKIGLKYYLDRSEEPNIEFIKASINNNLSDEAKKRLKELIKK